MELTYISCVFVCLCFVTVHSLEESFVDPSIRVTAELGHKTSNEFCEYYGYQPEIHNVTTDDGYILTLFQCNSKTAIRNGEVVIIHHGLTSSSDDFMMNKPSQSLAYVMADQGYDVWLINARGNFYSRRHESKNPNIPSSGFWNFSFDDIAYHDYPASYDYIRCVTEVQKFYVVAHSQGSSSMLVLLSMKPEFNDYFKAVSLMAPIGYLGHAAPLFKAIASFRIPLRMLKNEELLPRMRSTGCGTTTGAEMCNEVYQILFGKSNNLNITMIGTYAYHFPSGSSTNVGLNYLDELDLNYFGKLQTGLSTPPDFPMQKITAPLSLHYSTNDALTNPIDVEHLIRQLNGTSDLYVQVIDNGHFNHVDFFWGINASEVVYSEILEFFAKHK